MLRLNVCYKKCVMVNREWREKVRFLENAVYATARVLHFFFWDVAKGILKVEETRAWSFILNLKFRFIFFELETTKRARGAIDGCEWLSVLYCLIFFYIWSIWKKNWKFSKIFLIFLFPYLKFSFLKIFSQFFF